MEGQTIIDNWVKLILQIKQKKKNFLINKLNDKLLISVKD
jgi:hypothetical protein